jgi:hypothetical protein
MGEGSCWLCNLLTMAVSCSTCKVSLRTNDFSSSLESVLAEAGFRESGATFDRPSVDCGRRLGEVAEGLTVLRFKVPASGPAMEDAKLIL